MSSRRILIVGGSTRAAADSVRRAGWQPICADLFADLDLRRTSEVIPVRHYPESLPEDVARVRADGWFYCGALENQPDILERVMSTCALCGPLLGTHPAALRLVRSPQWLTDVLRSAGIRALDVASQSSPPAPDGSWLQKPLASAGGRSIRVWDQAAADVPLREPHYFQRRVSGMGLSAIFQVENGQIEWLGASRELESDSGSQPPSAFSYCGSCGPLKRMPFVDQKMAATEYRFRLSQAGDRRNGIEGRIGIRGCAVFQATIQRQLNLIARTLVSNVAGLRGLVGLDFRLEQDIVWLTEVNPRYTASVEVLELASGRSMLNRNAQAATSNHRVIAKQILYAATHLTAPNLSRYFGSADPWHVPVIADIPIPGTIVEPGWPICTVMAQGVIDAAVQTTLRHRVTEIKAALSGP